MTTAAKLMIEMKMTTQVRSDDEFMMLMDALEQYVQNTEEYEEDLSEDDKKKLTAARAYYERLVAVFCKLADVK